MEWNTKGLKFYDALCCDFISFMLILRIQLQALSSSSFRSFLSLHILNLRLEFSADLFHGRVFTKWKVWFETEKSWITSKHNTKVEKSSRKKLLRQKKFETSIDDVYFKWIMFAEKKDENIIAIACKITLATISGKNKLNFPLNVGHGTAWNGLLRCG